MGRTAFLRHVGQLWRGGDRMPYAHAVVTSGLHSITNNDIGAAQGPADGLLTATSRLRVSFTSGLYTRY